jgi:hypothetical protein
MPPEPSACARKGVGTVGMVLAIHYQGHLIASVGDTFIE